MTTVRRLLFGIRPALLAWWTVFVLLGLALLGGLVYLPGSAKLPVTLPELTTLGAQVLYRSLVAAFLTKGFLVMTRQPYVPTIFRAPLALPRNLYVASAMCSVFTLMLTFRLDAGQLGFWVAGFLPLVVTGALALVIERVLTPFYQDTAFWQRVYEVTHRPRPDWLLELQAELEHNPDYRSSE